MLRRIIRLLPVLALSACAGSADTAPLPTRFVIDTATPIPQAVSLPVRILDFWQPVTSQLEAGQVDEWRFVGQPGDTISLRAIGNEGVGLVLALRSESGAPLGEGSSLEATLPAGGVYVVAVRLAERSAPGGYQLGLGYTDRPNPLENGATPLPQVVGVPTPIPPLEGRGTFISRLAHDNTVGGTMTETDQDHIYTFDGAAGQFIRVEMNRISGPLDPFVTVYDPDGEPLAVDDNSGGGRAALLHNIPLAVDGLYSLQAHGGGFPGAYAVRVLIYDAPGPVILTSAPTPTPTATYAPATPTIAAAIPGNRLEDHVPVASALTRPGDIMIYPIYAAAGEILTIGSIPAQDSGLRTRMEVVNPEGLVVASAQASTSGAGSAALITPLRAELEGVYQVFVASEDGSIGAYIIAYGSGTTWQSMMRGLIEPDTASDGRIELRGARDVWSLYLMEGDIISAAISTPLDAPLDPIMELVSADAPRAIIAVDDNSGGDRNPLLSNIRIPASGLYHLRVRAAQAATTGPYTLIWRYVNRAATATPAPATALLFTVDAVVPDNAYTFYPFQGQAGQRVRISVIAGDGSGFDPVAALVGPDGVVLIEVDDSDGDLNARFVFDLPQDGTYNVRVNGYLQGGPFVLTVEQEF